MTMDFKYGVERGDIYWAQDILKRGVFSNCIIFSSLHHVNLTSISSKCVNLSNWTCLIYSFILNIKFRPNWLKLLLRWHLRDTLILHRVNWRLHKNAFQSKTRIRGYLILVILLYGGGDYTPNPWLFLEKITGVFWPQTPISSSFC